jgi:hypothetical protein
MFAPLILSSVLALTPMEAKPQVMIVGSWHWANPGQDMFNPTVPDIMGERRQKEAESLCAALAEFKPTIICVEATPDSNSTFNGRLDGYVRGEYTLLANEREQVAFRLAKACGVKEVFGIDDPSDMDFDAVTAAATEAGQGELLQAKFGEIGKMIGEMYAPERIEKMTLAQVLIENNRPEDDAMNLSLYMQFGMIGKAGDFRATDVQAGWMKRNLRMSANLVRHIKSPSDRVFLIVGSSHAAQMRSQLRDLGTVEVVDPVPYLKRVGSQGE